MLSATETFLLRETADSMSFMEISKMQSNCNLGIVKIIFTLAKL